ncbi:hypothetical protein HJC23_011944 [Cyclotella cryptica]|uniref:Ethylmalonyl-CoA decarboxylase n=1 Tax=Cyclotella cryptica TaxID=29204 RepID=A0ABD3QX47_9STRA|eukprot:CCRYP_002981-RB/>CCRYP_002981-RB protein AED:0.32 eAED:0.32 QI:228/1/1/1/0/0/3/898/367
MIGPRLLHPKYVTIGWRKSCSQRWMPSLKAMHPTNKAFASSYANNDEEQIPKVTLSFRHDNSVAILTLCNPQRRNALTFSMMEQLDEHVTTLERWATLVTVATDGMTRCDITNGSTDASPNLIPIESEIDSNAENNSRAIILTGAHGNFCSGLDLHDHAHSKNHPLQSGSQMNLHMTQVTNRLHCLPVPSISAIDGHAMGGGAELSTCTDFVVLSTSARVQFVHVRRGASPGWGGGRRLVKRVGRAKALKMLLMGECVSGQDEGRLLSFADGVGQEGESALDAAMRLIVRPILELPCSKAIRAVKSVVSAADGDEDVFDSQGMTILYDTNKALAAERGAFLSVWGGDSNLKQIRLTKEKLTEKKAPP